MTAHVVRRRDPKTGRWNSKPKFAFDNFVMADIVARRYYLWGETSFPEAYKCTKCAFYHVGRRPTNPRKVHGGRYGLPDGARGIYVGRQRLYRLMRKYAAQIQ